MRISNRFAVAYIIQIVIQSVTSELFLKDGSATVDSCGKKSSKLCFLGVLSTNKPIYHYCCAISIS